METQLKYIECTIHQFLDRMVQMEEIKECLQYAVSGGKRIRSLIYMMVLEQLARDVALSDSQLAVMNDGFLYVELVHAASLILDDMPHMDNDSVRRNLPTVMSVMVRARHSWVHSF